MPRYLKVRGRKDVLVANPHTSDRRYAGMRLRPTPEKGWPPGIPYAQMFEPAEQILLDHPDLRSAIEAGDLEGIQVGVGPTPDAAAFEPYPKPAVTAAGASIASKTSALGDGAKMLTGKDA